LKLSSLRVNQPERVILWTLVIFLVVGLAYFTFLGTYNRSYADDWCYNADYAQLGLRETLAGYSFNTTYSASRFSSTIFGGIFFYLGIPGLQVITLFVLVALTWGFHRGLENLAKIANLSIQKPIILAFAALVVFFSIYIAPLRYQSFYWLNGILPYTIPLLIGIWVATLLVEQASTNSRSPYVLPLLGALSFFGGGFSEAGAAFLLSLLFIILILATFYRRKSKWAAPLIFPVLWSLAWAIAAVLILLLSPAAWERASRYGELAGFVEFVGLTLRYSWDFVRFSILDLPLPHLALAATAAFLALINPHEFGKRKAWIAISLIVLIAFLLIASSYAPSALIEKNPPHPRTRVIARTTMLLSIPLITWLGVGLLHRVKTLKHWLKPSTILIGAISLIYIGRALLLTAEIQPIYSSRAGIWDQRHFEILEAADMGIAQVEVQAIDGAPIGGLRDFREAPGHWINVCAANVYGVEEISGLP
jgi:hypothetical protein